VAHSIPLRSSTDGLCVFWSTVLASIGRIQWSMDLCINTTTEVYEWSDDDPNSAIRYCNYRYPVTCTSTARRPDSQLSVVNASRDVATNSVRPDHPPRTCLRIIIEAAGHRTSRLR